MFVLNIFTEKVNFHEIVSGVHEMYLYDHEMKN